MAIPRIIILAKNFRGQSYALENESYTIGRLNDRDIFLPDGTMSSLHATLTRDAEGNCTLIDNGSTNGTRVNGTRITEQLLSSGDVIQFGGVEAYFDSGDSTEVKTTHNIPIIDITQTIEIDPKNMSNLSSFASSTPRRTGGGASKGMLAVIIILIVAVLGLAGVLAMQLS